VHPFADTLMRFRFLASAAWSASALFQVLVCSRTRSAVHRVMTAHSLTLPYVPQPHHGSVVPRGPRRNGGAAHRRRQLAALSRASMHGGIGAVPYEPSTRAANRVRRISLVASVIDVYVRRIVGAEQSLHANGLRPRHLGASTLQLATRTFDALVHHSDRRLHLGLYPPSPLRA